MSAHIEQGGTSRSGPRVMDCMSEPLNGQEQVYRTLEELHALLQEYAPTWYTQEHFERSVAALEFAKTRA